MLTIEQLKSLAEKPKVVKVDAPEWSRNGSDGACVYVRGLLTDEFEALQDGKGEADTDLRTAARFCCAAICDENGNRLFADGDIDTVLKLPIGPLLRCSAAIQALSGLGADVEELAGN